MLYSSTNVTRPCENPTGIHDVVIHSHAMPVALYGNDEEKGYAIATL